MSDEVGTVQFNDAPQDNAPAQPTPITVSESDLEKLIESAQQKITAMRAASFATDNRAQAAREIQACETAISNCDVQIAKFDALIEEAVIQIDAAIALPPSTGMFGVPQVAVDQARIKGAGAAYAGLRQARYMQVVNKANLEVRLASLRRVAAQMTPKV